MRLRDTLQRKEVELYNFSLRNFAFWLLKIFRFSSASPQQGASQKTYLHLANTKFWPHICLTSLFRSVGILAEAATTRFKRVSGKRADCDHYC